MLFEYKYGHEKLLSETKGYEVLVESTSIQAIAHFKRSRGKNLLAYEVFQA